MDNDIEFSMVTDKPESGMWHCGPNNIWITVTHKPTMQSVTVYGRSQHKAREAALLMLELILDDCRYERCLFPELMESN